MLYNPEDQVISKTISSDAWYDASKDLLNVKVRIECKTKEGKLIKKGCIFSITEEMLDWIAEGQEYVRKPIPKNRFELILEEEQ